MIKRRALYQALFVAAGIYNIAWGVYCIIDPAWLFRLTGSETQDRAEVVSALGLVIGLYGVLYLGVARDLDLGAQVVAVGLAGKVLGPIGVAYAVTQRSWPASTFLVCVTNDFIWLAPFALYLYDVRRRGRTAQIASSKP